MELLMSLFTASSDFSLVFFQLWDVGGHNLASLNMLK
jgi:hypothetical protein